MAPDGKSLISSVGTTDHTVWLHDKDGDHQVSSEGDGLWPTFSSDGRSLYFLMANGQTHGEELWVKDLSNGKTDRVLPGYSMQSSSLNAKNYSVSNDGRQVAFVMTDQTGHSALWIAPTSHRSSPRRISSNASEDSPLFLPSGDLVFRAIEGGTNFLYRMKPDGTGRHKIIPDHILEFTAVSPDGRWAAAATADPDEEHPASLKAFAIDGGPPVTLCTPPIACWIGTPPGKFVYVSFPDFHEGSFAVPVMQDTGLPRVPPGGIANIRDVTNVKTIAAVPWNVGSAITPSIYGLHPREHAPQPLSHSAALNCPPTIVLSCKDGLPAIHHLQAPGRPAPSHRRTRLRPSRRRERSGPPRRHRLRQDLHHGQDHRRGPAPRPHPRAQQDPRRPALPRVQDLFPQQRRRILRLLLRLLPA